MRKLIILIFCALAISCIKKEKGIPKIIEPIYKTSKSDYLNKLEENDSVSLGFGQTTTVTPFTKVTTRKLTLTINKNSDEREITKTYLQQRNKRISQISSAEIKNLNQFDHINLIYKTKNGDEIKSEIVID